MTAPRDMADDEMNTAIAVEVMQWTWTAYDHPTPHNRGFWQTGRDESSARVQDFDWSPTTDAADTEQMIARALELGLSVYVGRFPHHQSSVGIENLARGPLYGTNVRHEDWRRAACEAILQAVRSMRAAQEAGW